MVNFYELIITTIRNRTGVYIDHEMCINAEMFAREIEKTLMHKLSITRSKDAFNAYNIIDEIVLIIKQKEAQLGIYNDPRTRYDYTSTTKETSKTESRGHSASKNDFYTFSRQDNGAISWEASYRARLGKSTKHKSE